MSVHSYPTLDHDPDAVVREICPDALVLSSRAQEWSGIAAMRLHHEGEGLLVPPIPTHLVSIYLGQRATAVTESIEGHIYQAYITTGAVTVIPAGLPTGWRWTGHPDVLHLHLTPRFLSAVAAEACVDPDHIQILNSLGVRDPLIEHSGMALLAELENGGLGGRLFAESCAALLGVHLLRHYSSLRPPSPRGDSHGLSAAALRRAIEFIEENLAQDLALAHIADAAALSPYHFAHGFKQSTGVSPHQYVIGRRVERAKTLLATGNLPLTTIARRVGFYDQSHLTHHFKRLVGVTPARHLADRYGRKNLPSDSTNLQDRSG
jgi:AraC family transcriptional regulator